MGMLPTDSSFLQKLENVFVFPKDINIFPFCKQYFCNQNNQFTKIKSGEAMDDCVSYGLEETKDIIAIVDFTSNHPEYNPFRNFRE